MNDPKAKASELIGIADKELAELWEKSPAVVGADGWGLTFGSREAGTAYVQIAGEWIAEANKTLAEMDPSDPATVIDQLGDRVDVVIARRTKLFGQGMGLQDPLSEGMKTFVAEVVRRIKKLYETATNPTVLGLGMLGVVLILFALIAARR